MPAPSSPPSQSEMTLPRLLGALSDPTRLGIVRVLSDGAERGWGQLRAPVAKSTLSHHLKVLREAGVTRTRQDGTRCFVTLRRDSLDARFPGLLPALLSAAIAEDVGAHVTESDDEE
ncbi:helix-turn-helix transcriptional regulator [Streptomyces sp. NBC_00268]|uniref:ArsR/SmtB family transcription factor n=2 Tax=unclassified Streptomyces TaxID=2593676 RepID=UPI0022520B99|nr:metalloregulator ArsR/SmtB family transcription factor [Streptomyces sp. NBC_00268]MCX5181603.1 helix-turn-helix domain-containing protein [Streptomyces sp. NBC_00268]